MKIKLLLLFVLIATFGYAQTFDWETAYFGSDTPTSSGWTKNRAIQQFTNPYNAVVFTTPNATPINISNVGQGSTGLSVRNAAFETSVEAYFGGNFLNIQSIKVFAYPNSSNENWTFKGKDAGGNVTNTLTAAVTNTASVITLNFTNVYVLEITKTDGTIGSFGVDDIVFTPYVAPIVTIPDANFKAYLLNNYSINTNYDSEIQVSEATSFTGSINCPNENISDLTGIEAFTALTELFCYYNQLTSLDVSANTALEILSPFGNPITSIDVSANTALIGLALDSTSITSIDVSANTALTTLSFRGNAITSIDVSANTALQELYFSDTQLTSIDLSTNTDLRWVEAHDVQLTSLDLSAQPNLEELYCYDNSQLTSLNIANGNNANMYYFDAQNNADLTCIQVDAAIVGTTPTGWYKDAGATYSASCTTCTVNIPDANFKTYLVGNSLINTNGDTEIQCSEASAFTGVISAINANISSLVGIEAFTQLRFLQVADNQLTSVDVSNNTALVGLYCVRNSITNLDLRVNTALTEIALAGNSLTYLNIANGNNSNFIQNGFNSIGNPNLTCITVDDVAYSNANWSNGIDAQTSFSTSCAPCTVNIPDANFKTYLVGNSLINTNGDTEIQCSEASAFTGEIFLYNLGISDLTGIEAFTALTQLTAANNQLTSLDVSANIALEILSANSNQLTSLDVSANIALEELFCNGNQLTSLDVSTNTALNTLYCNDNQLTSLDVSAHSNLVLLVCNDNQLTSLNIANGNNANMYYFDAQNNAGLTCIQVDAAIVGTSPAGWDKDATASYSANCAALSVDDFSLNTVSIYPNPTTSVLHIEMDQDLKQATIYSMLGEQVLRTQNSNIDVSALANSVYLMKIETENGNVLIKRFVKK